ncbi:MFS transporter [Chungangia koreensis]|uniref:MFS transporter n=1 Tax=Chungangia koreensis TaxID=752657 RepID=A0ABV8X3T1_9LACT
MKDFRSFMLLWSSQTISNAGDVFYIVGLISIVYQLTDSVMMVSLIPLTNTLSRMVGGLITPILIHQLPLRRILTMSMFLKIMALAILYLVHGAQLIWILVLVGINSFLDGWASPTRNAMIPEFAGKEALLKANSMTAISDNSVFLISWPVGSLFVAAFGSEKLLGLTVIIYAVAWVLMLFVRQIAHEPDIKLNIIQQLLDGWTYILKVPSLKAVFTIDMIITFSSVVWASAFLLVYVDEVLGKGETWWGYINAVFFSGFIIAGFLYSKLAKFQLNKIILICSLFTTILTFFFAFPNGAVGALLIIFALGVCGQFQGLAQLTIIQTNTLPNQLAKVFSAQDVLITGSYAVSMLLFGWIGEMVNIRFVFILSGVLMTIVTIYILRRRSVLVAGE